MKTKATRACRKQEPIVGNLHIAKRCRFATGFVTLPTTHAATHDETLCGRTLTRMWFIAADKVERPSQIGCRVCRARLIANTSPEVRR